MENILKFREITELERVDWLVMGRWCRGYR